jgi:inosine/xanthosine triphosphatase
VIIASTNPVKIQSTEDGFKKMFPDENIEVIGKNVASGVSHQPITDHETYTGAKTRAENAKIAFPDADFWVGIEGGVEENMNDPSRSTMVAFAWVVVFGSSNDISGEARSASFRLPRVISDLIRQGIELGEADDRVFGVQNSKQQNGAVGLLTRNVVDRFGLYSMPVVLSLIPICNFDLYGK